MLYTEFTESVKKADAINAMSIKRLYDRTNFEHKVELSRRRDNLRSLKEIQMIRLFQLTPLLLVPINK